MHVILLQLTDKVMFIASRTLCTICSCLQRIGHTSYRDFSHSSRLWNKMKRSADGGVMLRHLRYREKLGGQLDPPGCIELVVVSSGVNGTPKSFTLNTDHIRYLFNCGEGTQRIATEQKAKLCHVEHIFVTHGSWENIGGLMGMCLTLETGGVPQVTLYGPPKIEEHVKHGQKFSQIRKTEIVKREASEGDYVDSVMRVEFVPILPTTSAASEEPEPASDSTLSNSSNNMAVMYVCKPHPKLRTLSLERCVDHNVPAGPLMGRLKSGETVTLDSGAVVTPDDVLEPVVLTKPFIVVDCPSFQHLDSLVTNSHVLRYTSSRSGSEDELEPCLIVHFTPAAIMESDAYQSWMSQFGSETDHLVLNELGADLVSEAVYEAQAKLNLLDQNIFPLLPLQRQNPPPKKAGTDSSHVVYAETNLKYDIRGPCMGFNHEKCLRLDNEKYTSEAFAEEDFCEALSCLQKNVSEMLPAEGSEANVYPELLFLGTGSAVPNKLRNVSAILLNLSDDDSMLLDCGENTLGQLYRHFGSANIVDVLQKLRAVFISHLHADHHLGVIAVALERYILLSQVGRQPVKPLEVLAPNLIKPWYDLINSELIPLNSVIRVIPVESFQKDVQSLNNMELLNMLGLDKLQAVHVRHRQCPHGAVLVHRSGWKLVYSGDTMPCNALVKAGRDCDVLIHEATMEDDLVESAIEKRHSTTSQAIDVGLRMKAKFIILTHFSQRYAKVPVFTNNFRNCVATAFDNMRVRFCDLRLLPMFTPALKAMFAEEYLQMEVKSIKKSRAKRLLARKAENAIQDDADGSSSDSDDSNSDSDGSNGNDREHSSQDCARAADNLS